MARPLRVEFGGAVYHVSSRGNGGAPIVYGDKDRTRRLEWLVIGSEEFLEQVGERSGLSAADPEIEGSRGLVTGKPIEEVVAEMAQGLGVDPSSWSSRRRRDSGHRAVAAYAARRLLGYRRGEVAESLGYRSPSSVAHAERRVEDDRKLIRQAKKAARAVEKKE